MSDWLDARFATNAVVCLVALLAAFLRARVREASPVVVTPSVGGRSRARPSPALRTLLFRIEKGVRKSPRGSATCLRLIIANDSTSTEPSPQGVPPVSPKKRRTKNPFSWFAIHLNGCYKALEPGCEKVVA